MLRFVHAAHCLDGFSADDLLNFTQVYVGLLNYNDVNTCTDCDVRGVKVSLSIQNARRCAQNLHRLSTFNPLAPPFLHD